MARKAIKDTFATIITGGVEQRVHVFAGHVVPSTYQMEEGSYEEVEGGVTSVGAPSAPPSDTPAPETEDASAEASPPSPRSRRSKSKDSGADSSS